MLHDLGLNKKCVIIVENIKILGKHVKTLIMLENNENVTLVLFMYPFLLLNKIQGSKQLKITFFIKMQ